jgi:hypothetical protein
MRSVVCCTICEDYLFIFIGSVWSSTLDRACETLRWVREIEDSDSEILQGDRTVSEYVCYHKCHWYLSTFRRANILAA